MDEVLGLVPVYVRVRIEGGVLLLKSFPLVQVRSEVDEKMALFVLIEIDPTSSGLRYGGPREISGLSSVFLVIYPSLFFPSTGYIFPCNSHGLWCG